MSPPTTASSSRGSAGKALAEPAVLVASFLAPFIEKLIAEYASGRVEQAILLTHNYSDTEWFHAAARTARMICFPSGRNPFRLAGCGDENSPMQGQAFFNFGADDEPFRRVFGAIGLVARPLP